MKYAKVYLSFVCSAFILMPFGVSSIEVVSNEVEESKGLDQIELDRLLKHKKKKDKYHKGKKKCKKEKHEKDGKKKKKNCKKEEDKRMDTNMNVTNATEAPADYYYYVYYDDDAKYYYYDDDLDYYYGNAADDDHDTSTSTTAAARSYGATEYNGDDDGSSYNVTVYYGDDGNYGTTFSEASGTTAASAWRNFFFVIGFVIAATLLILPMRRGRNENEDSNRDSKLAIGSGMAEKSTNYHQMEDKPTNAGEIA